MKLKLILVLLIISNISFSKENSNLQKAVNASSGNNNWQTKRDTQTKARNAYQEEQKVLKDINVKNVEITKLKETQEEALNKFYAEIGLEEMPLLDTISGLLEKITTSTVLTSTELSDIKLEYIEKEKDLKKINEYLEEIKDINTNLVTTVATTVVAQVQRAESNDDKISANLEKIEQTVDADQAVALFAQIENLLADTKAVLSWLNNEITDYITSQSADLSKLYTQIHATITNLEKKDVIIKSAKTDKSKSTDTKHSEKESPENKKPNFFEKIWQSISDIWGKIANWFKKLFVNQKTEHKPEITK